MQPTLNPKARNYRLGWTNSVHTPAGEPHWRFGNYSPTTGYMGASGIIREYRAAARQNRTNEWSVAVWQGDEVLALGSEVRDMIIEYEAERAYA